MEENHDLDGLESEVASFLVDASADESITLTQLENQLSKLRKEKKVNSEKILSTVQNLKEEFEKDINATFSKLKENLNAKKSFANQSQESKKIEDNPMVPIMLEFKKSVFSTKKATEKKLSEEIAQLDLKRAAKEYIFAGGKREALKGILNLKSTGELNSILLKISFSLVVAEMRTPFIERAPKDVQNHFEVYLSLLKKGLKVPFFEFYRNTEIYLQEFKD